MLNLLNDVRVFELGHILMAPYATQFLGDMGADVIKVEPLGGDLYRTVGVGRNAGMSAQWMDANRNKRSIALDLKSEEGRAVLREMIAHADILVHNMRSPAIERLGFGYDAVKQINPRLVYCAAIGFGRGGPYADLPAFDDVIQARSGLTAINGRLNGRPSFVPVAIADKAVGLMVGQAMLAGLHRQRATGKGCYLETPMFEAMVGIVLNQHLNGHAFRPPIDGLGYARVMSPYRHPSPTADGYIVHGVYKFEQWQRFLARLGRQDVLDGPLMADRHAMAKNIAQLYEITSTEILPQKTTAEWARILDELDIPSAPVLDLDDLENDPHLSAVGLFEDYDHPTQGPMRQVRAPYGARDVDRTADRFPPDLGAHGTEVLREFGFDADRIAALHDRGVLAQARKPDSTPPPEAAWTPATAFRSISSSPACSATASAAAPGRSANRSARYPNCRRNTAWRGPPCSRPCACSVTRGCCRVRAGATPSSSRRPGNAARTRRPTIRSISIRGSR